MTYNFVEGAKHESFISQLPFDDVSPPNVAYIKFVELHSLGMCEQYEANNFLINNGNIIFFHMNTKETGTIRDIFCLSSPILHTPFNAPMRDNERFRIQRSGSKFTYYIRFRVVSIWTVL